MSANGGGGSHVNGDISPPVTHHMCNCVTETRAVAEQTVATELEPQRGPAPCPRIVPDLTRTPAPCHTHPVCSPKAHSRRGRPRGGSRGQTPHSPRAAGGSWRRGTPDEK